MERANRKRAISLKKLRQRVRRYRARKRREQELDEVRIETSSESSDQGDLFGEDNRSYYDHEYEDQETIKLTSNDLKSISDDDSDTTSRFFESFSDTDSRIKEKSSNEYFVPDQTNEMDEFLDYFAIRITGIKSSSNVSDSAIEKILGLVSKNAKGLAKLLELKPNALSYKHSLKPRAIQKIPMVKNAFLIEKKSSQTTLTYEYTANLDKVPKQVLRYRSLDNKKLLRIDSYVTLKSIKRFHRNRMEQRGKSEEEIQADFKNCALSVDGVRVSQGSKTTFIVVTIRIGLKCIYIWIILCPLIGIPAAKPSIEELLRRCIVELNEDSEIYLKNVVADMVERHTLRGMISISGKYSCEFCEAPGCTGYGAGITWPMDESVGYPLRGHDEFENIARNHRSKGPEFRKGIVNVSPLLDLNQDFDIIMDIPIDEFHLVKEGLAKQMMKRMFVSRNTITSRRALEEMSMAYESMDVFSETPRRPRPIQVLQFKGSEFGVLVMSVFPHFFKTIIKNKTTHWTSIRRALAIFTFLVRLYNYDDERLHDAETELKKNMDCSFEDLHLRFYAEYMQGFCERTREKATINAHTFMHLYESRMHSGPLWSTSAEPFESLYAVLRRCYQSGTRNISKQAIENHFLRAQDFAIPDDTELIIRVKENRDQVADNLIVTSTGHIGAVYNINGDVISCYLVSKLPFNTEDIGLHLPWKCAGVFRYNGINYQKERHFQRSQVIGKAMICGETITEWLSPWLMSKFDV